MSALFTALFASWLLLAAGPSHARPNVLLIMTDDQGFSDVGFNGNPIVQTPELDRLARSAVTFNNFYVQPVCSPSRAALMTGRHPLRTGVLDTESGVAVLPPAEVTLAEALKKNGYITGLFGKWHLGDHAPARPQDHQSPPWLSVERTSR
jgi:arylsulfatase A-like enzyme